MPFTVKTFLVMKTYRPLTALASAALILSLTSCADIKQWHNIPSSYDGGYRSFGYAGTPTEVYKKAYDCGVKDLREHCGSDWRRHSGQVHTELMEYHILGYAEGYAGIIRKDCTVPSLKSALARRTYGISCCSGSAAGHSHPGSPKK